MLNLKPNVAEYAKGQQNSVYDPTLTAAILENQKYKIIFVTVETRNVFKKVKRRRIKKEENITQG